ncbi:MAG TPA: N-acetyl-gamma-glutamyl-phosphate reductase [Fermentimonas caenicola]|jgi:N-acetyl-gamma-glutamyl-phosphate reductase|uniref:N-acetyl-gamma-glutamyl-phosphate reductase n=1 Tax=Fermentimonas caenicola TaxID=1562970 RepID=A0A098BZ73_9BACT|nr:MULTISPECIES: N-acetyl-gamma-glutamyl-phosphate reductase [Lascolabacillus]MBP6175258.1 N-acetyl-gamma-glutamyl-phosphate reductase [Fermentimonas sp.]MDI9625944.1 N-acetyl-gamma-glutamyl-phosphate reductase [Bacteroidota bacterium]TAH61464.1 MAG: N-acetyl-gamma-glutamyl-phosphate reductase [Fermentimonas caenicola]MBP6196893.1 N-acetyl-gamma-glutamyl-phosphate reductase [Fermentimonas sp.]MBP7104187.1 N-acetyl-gamma-glutamyl-phosphate reductase [Fermentimonas sp.]
MINVSIAGGTGYTAGELLRILLHHPEVNIESVISTTSVGMSVSDIHRDLIGETDLVYSDTFKNPDVIFLCLGHGLSREFLEKNELPAGCKVIDLGNDFRNQPEFGNRKFVFGLCEQNREEIRKADNVANPGCFATTIMLALLPLASKNLLTEDIHIHAITGSTGAGKKPGETTHFSYRDNNISVYKPFTHQHLEEISNTLISAGNSNLPQINFVPMRGDFTRGIFASLYTKWNGTITDDEAIAYFKDYYADSPFVFVSDKPISLKEVVNTNKCLLHIEFHNGYIHITSISDNLVKGASGQAVQNMNLMFGFDESLGLKLKGSAF